MRAIRFRLWDKKHKSFVNEPYHAISLLGTIQIGAHSSVEPNRYVILQFTGLQDSNGKDIYEGDIVKCPGYPRRGTVVWHDSTAGFIVMERNDKRAHGLCDIWEVTGNIYEHPDLLK